MEITKIYPARLLAIVIPVISGIALCILGTNGYFKFDNLTLLLMCIMFGISAIGAILNLFPLITSLTTTPKGIMVRSFFRKTFVNWN